MGYILREYQKEAVNSAINWVRKNTSPCVMELATGAGKSLICAEIARIMHQLSGKKVLCLCPTAELVEQNAEKFELTGEKFSIYSASISKSLIHNVIFATEGTFKSVALEQGEKFSCVIIDEAHRITPTIKKIIDEMRSKNPFLRVIGMSGSPYRMLTGYIYAHDEHGRVISEEETIEPYFDKLVYRVDGQYLVDHGYLTKPVIGQIGVSGYDTSGVKVKSNGLLDPSSVDEAFVGKGKKTAAIVADVIQKANAIGSKGVMFFAATIAHAHEVMESLPSYNSALVTGDMPKKERKRIIKEYKNRKIKYLVNVSVLTTGFDAPHTDVIAILRATESAGLLVQIIGRGLRLYDGKDFCLILDYAENIPEFFPDGCVFRPSLKVRGKKEQPKGEFLCEKCLGNNIFSLRPNPDGYDIDKNGYFVDLMGARISFGTEGFPGHYGRRCTHTIEKGKNVFERCDYFWTCKTCHKCDHKNDIAARFCESCKSQLIDPNEKLSIDFQQYKNDLTQVQTDVVKSFIKKQVRLGLVLMIFETEFRHLEVFFSEKVNRKFYDIVREKGFSPTTISYKQQSDSKYFIISDFNRPPDSETMQ